MVRASRARMYRPTPTRNLRRNGAKTLFGTVRDSPRLWRNTCNLDFTEETHEAGPGEETVALVLEVVPTAGADRLSEQPAVFLEDLSRGGVAQCLNQAGGTLDICEEERDCACW